MFGIIFGIVFTIIFVYIMFGINLSINLGITFDIYIFLGVENNEGELSHKLLTKKVSMTVLLQKSQWHARNMRVTVTFGGIFLKFVLLLEIQLDFLYNFKSLSKKPIKTCIKIYITHQTLLKPM